jgi:hypothetical protein
MIRAAEAEDIWPEQPDTLEGDRPSPGVPKPDSS